MSSVGLKPINAAKIKKLHDTYQNIKKSVFLPPQKIL
jgi:hypothetical protein